MGVTLLFKIVLVQSQITQAGNAFANRIFQDQTAPKNRIAVRSGAICLLSSAKAANIFC